MASNEESLFACEPADPIVELCLCEQKHLVLKPNQLYRFTVDKTCKACLQLAEEGKENGS